VSAKKIRAVYVTFITGLFLGILVLLIFPFKKINSFLRKKASSMILLFARAKVKTFGEPHLETTMFIINHKSMMDIMLIEKVTKQHDICWVAKKELFDLKFYGNLLKVPKMISVARETKRSIVQLIRDTEDRLKDGRTIAIFPEGTRNVENSLLEFKSGASIVANRYRLRVQPILIKGTEKVFNNRDFLSEKSDIEVYFLDSFIANDEKDWLNESREKMLEILQKDSSQNS
jgi:1-acyl-sn-glycerol-3-phosphate acyltransferase